MENESAENKSFTCKDCSAPFVLEPGEIEFYNTRVADDGNRMSLPKRCKQCRIKRKNERNTHVN